MIDEHASNDPTSVSKTVDAMDEEGCFNRDSPERVIRPIIFESLTSLTPIMVGMVEWRKPYNILDGLWTVV